MRIINHISRILFDVSPIFVGSKICDVKIQNVAIDNNICLYIYKPYHYKIDRRVVLYLHGGGWVIGSIKAYDRILRHISYHADSIVVAVEYRKAPEHKSPIALDDCYKAYKWVSDNFFSSPNSNNNLIICGDSAGGNLAIGVLKRLSKSKIENSRVLHSLILIYPLLEGKLRRPSQFSSYTKSLIYRVSKAILKYSLRNYLESQEERNSNYISLIDSFDQDINYPKVLVIKAGLDALNPSIDQYILKLKNIGTKVDSKTYHNVPHGFINFGKISSSARTALDDIVEFIRRK